MARNTQCTCNTSCRLSQKSFGFYNISFEIWKGTALPYQNIERKSISASYYNNNLNHETKGHLKKIIIPCSIYHAVHIDSSKSRCCKVGHIDGRRSLEQKYGV
jgi:hypothetical protein